MVQKMNSFQINNISPFICTFDYTSLTTKTTRKKTQATAPVIMKAVQAKTDTLRETSYHEI